MNTRRLFLSRAIPVLFIASSSALFAQTDTVDVVIMSGGAAASPYNALCEGSVNPAGVTDTTPEFSWTYVDYDTGDTGQTGYQILVGYRSDFAGDVMWDSGKVDSAGATNISYSGTALSTDGNTLFWKVRTWDGDGNAGPYCYPQFFTMSDADPLTATVSLQVTVDESPTAPFSLRCEGASNPSGVTDTTPELSAISTDPDPADYALAFQIVVAKSGHTGGTGKLDTNVVWDTGDGGDPCDAILSNQGEGSRGPEITGAAVSYSYDGGATETLSFNGGRYYWQIRYFDESGPGAWSAGGANWFDMRDASAPGRPEISSMVLDALDDLTITGTAAPDSSVRIYDNGALVGTVTADENGNFSYRYTPSSPLDEGAHLITATANYGGGESAAARAPYRVLVESAVYPDTSVTHGGAGTSLRFEGATAYDFKAAVNAGGTVTVTAWMYRNASYAGTAPSMTLTGLGIDGTGGATASMAGGAGAWEQLTVSETPNADGVLTLRVETYSTAAEGMTYVDSVTVSE